ncbi:MAG: energy transducer TonB [Gemmatimonadaceae bacterium]
MSGEVLLRYVVSSAGRVDPQSVTVPSATNATFLASVREQMSAWRFAPATVNGCAVSRLVVQPFTFAIAK